MFLSRSRLVASLLAALACGVLSAGLGFVWYGVNAENKLAAVLSPTIGQDLAIHAQIPSPFPPAVVLSVLAAVALVVVGRMLPRRVEHVSPAAVFLVPLALWAVIATQWLSRALGVPVSSMDYMFVFTWGEFGAASVVLVFPWAVAAAALGTRE